MKIQNQNIMTIQHAARARAKKYSHTHRHTRTHTHIYIYLYTYKHIGCGQKIEKRLITIKAQWQQWIFSSCCFIYIYFYECVVVFIYRIFSQTQFFIHFDIFVVSKIYILPILIAISLFLSVSVSLVPLYNAHINLVDW